MPRRYRLGKRADLKQETRERIIAAATRVFRERGMAGTSNVTVAREADVAPATVRNHFPDRRDLANAVFDQILDQLRPPTPAVLAGADTLRERIARLASALAAFYERSEAGWQIYRQEPDLIDAWSGGVDRYYRDIDELMRTALGPLAGDETALAVVAAVIGPPAFFALRARGIASDRAVELCVDLAVPWLERRQADVARGPR